MYLIKRNKYYYIYDRDAVGKMKAVSTKKGTKREAMIVLQEMESQNIPSSNFPKVTFPEFIDRFMEYAKINFSPTYVEQFFYAFRELKIEVWDKLLFHIDHNDIEKMASRRRTEGKNTSTNNFIACLRSAFNKAIDWELIKDNPVAKIKKKKMPKNHPVFITEEEFNKLMEFEHNQLAKSAYILAFYTGCRISELLK